jgi:CheY-like chemotaxis protein
MSSSRSSRPRDSAKGTGLGLSQVYGFCRQAGGTARILATSAAGTTVLMLLPATAKVSDAPRSEVEPAPAPEHRELLLVEDNDELGQATETLLTLFGYRVTRASSAEEAIQFLDAGEVQFDVVLSDVVMPGGMNGVSFAQYLRKNLPEMPIILITGYASHLRDKHGFEILQKPCAPDVLLAALRRATGQPACGLTVSPTLRRRPRCRATPAARSASARTPNSTAPTRAPRARFARQADRRASMRIAGPAASRKARNARGMCSSGSPARCDRRRPASAARPCAPRSRACRATRPRSISAAAEFLAGDPRRDLGFRRSIRLRVTDPAAEGQRRPGLAREPDAVAQPFHRQRLQVAGAVFRCELLDAAAEHDDRERPTAGGVGLQLADALVVQCRHLGQHQP